MFCTNLPNTMFYLLILLVKTTEKVRILYGDDN